MDEPDDETDGECCQDRPAVTHVVDDVESPDQDQTDAEVSGDGEVEVTRHQRDHKREGEHEQDRL